MSATTSSLPVPPEIVHEIIRHLTLTSDCSSCLQTDLSALAASSKILSAIATPYLYSSITLHTAHDAPEPAAYERRLTSLLHTLQSTSNGALIRHLQFSRSQPATADLWSSIVALTPNLHSLHGIDSLFSPHDDPDEDAQTLAADALLALSHLRKAALYQETLPCPLSSLLSAWSSVETLALGEIVADDSTFQDLAHLSPSIKSLFFHDFDLDYSRPEERDDALATLPPALATLAIDYSLGFSLDGVARYLAQTPAHANTLKNLEFHNQLRRNNPVRALKQCLAAAAGLKRLALSLTRYPADIAEQPEFLESASLEVLEWRGIYTTPAAAAGGNDEFLHTLISSLGGMPRLRVLRVGCEVRGAEVDMFCALREECERAGSVVTMDAMEVGKGGKRVFVEFDAVGGTAGAERALGMKFGTGVEGGVCAVVKEEEGKEEEGECAGDWEA